LAVQAEQRHPRTQTGTTPSAAQSILSGALTITAMLGFIIALLATAVIGYGLMFRDQVYPGVQAVGVNIGGVSAAEAEAALDQRTSEYMASEMTLVHQGQTFSVTPAELGVTFDNARTVERAYEFGRNGTWWTDSRDWFDSLFFGHDVGVTPVIDSTQLQGYFQGIAGEIGARPQEPSFQLNSEGQLLITPALAGLGIDLEQTSRELRSELSALGHGPVDISTIEVAPAFTEEALEPVGHQISGIVSEEFVLERGEYRWVLDAQRLDSLLNVSINPETGESSLSVNTERLHRTISGLAENAHADGRDARVFWSGERFEVREATDGWRIDVDASVDTVEAAILAGEHYAELAITEYPASITTDEAQDAADYGNQLASSPFELTWSEGEATLGGTVIAAALDFEHDSESGTIIPTVDVDDLTLFLSSILSDVEVRPVNADLRYIDGEIEVRSEEEYGWEMDRPASAQAIANAIADGETSAEIVVNEAEPEVTVAMAEDIEIREMLSHGETYYGGSAANRAHNVELATELANGALIPPGGLYSFNQSIGGEITEEVGFQQGFGIEGATDGGVTTVPTVGGGVCQVSTTVFQAAFWAGMQIEERNWHMYWMPLYGNNPTGMTGLDATIATGAGLDFTFKNTTDDWIAIVAIADGNMNRFEIWGTDPGWEVETEGPHITNRVSASSEIVEEETDQLPAGTRSQVETAHDGFDVEIKRWVFDSDGNEIDALVLESRYQPASNRVLIGTGS
jgi:vancomycin resistance protein YoaR